jgi:hypothetical protein
LATFYDLLILQVRTRPSETDNPSALNLRGRRETGLEPTQVKTRELLFYFCIKSTAAVSTFMESTIVVPLTSDNQPENHQPSHSSHSHHVPKTMTQTATVPRSVELPPPAWGSPAHLAARRAEKEWTQHLRAHASADAAARKIGKHARYVDAVDVVVRYSLPPDWSLAGDDSENTKGTVREGDAIWELPESDEVLVAVLKASSQPFFQRTGEFSKVR